MLMLMIFVKIEQMTQQFHSKWHGNRETQQNPMGYYYLHIAVLRTFK